MEVPGRYAVTRVFAALMLTVAGASAARCEGLNEVAPTGSLRVAVGVGPAASAFWTTRDPATGKPHGVTVELAKAAADKLQVPLQIVEYPNSGEIAAAGSKEAWDISFMPADPERAKLVDHGPAYVAYESGYLVRAGSNIRTVADVDRDGVRVGCIDGTSTSRTVANALKHAHLDHFARADVAAELIGKGQLDAVAMGMEALNDLSRKLPGTRVLPEVIQSTGVVVVVPKGHAAVGAWAAEFLKEAKADGTVRRALDGSGFNDAKVAP
jgi:polar amino acid transport system substrate-binding protein